jgi:hypothetical protein
MKMSHNKATVNRVTDFLRTSNSSRRDRLINWRLKQELKWFHRTSRRTVMEYKMKELITLALEANRKHREKFKDALQEMPLDYRTLRDYCTVRLDIGHRTGKTTAVIELAGPNDLIVVPNERVKYKYQRCVSLATCEAMGRLSTSTVLVGRAFDRIWVEETMLYSNGALVAMYERLGHSYNQTFILLG